MTKVQGTSASKSHKTRTKQSGRKRKKEWVSPPEQTSGAARPDRKRSKGGRQKERDAPPPDGQPLTSHPPSSSHKTAASPDALNQSISSNPINPHATTTRSADRSTPKASSPSSSASSSSSSESSAPSPQQSREDERSPPSWKDLKSYADGHLMSHDAFKLLYRSPKDQKKYVEQREEKRKKYVHYSDFIKHNFLEYDVEIVVNDADGMEKLKAINADHDQLICNLMPNNFPCELQAPARHFVLFANKVLNAAEIQATIDSTYVGTEYIYWENPPWRKSVPEVFHIHALIVMPTSWKQLQPFVTDNVLSVEALEFFERAPELTKEYEKSRERQTKVWVEYADYLKHQYLSIDAEAIEWEDGSKRWRTVSNDDDGDQHAELHPNRYPYNLEPSVKHFVLWSTSHCSPKTISEIVLKKYPKHEYLWWENPLHKKTVPEIWHIHVLIKLLDNASELLLRGYIGRCLEIQSEIPMHILTMIQMYHPYGRE